jgi:hypothetical protein
MRLGTPRHMSGCSENNRKDRQTSGLKSESIMLIPIPIPTPTGMSGMTILYQIARYLCMSTRKSTSWVKD